MGEQPKTRSTLSKHVSSLRDILASTLRRVPLAPKPPQKHRSSFEVGYVVLPTSLFYLKVKENEESDKESSMEGQQRQITENDSM